MVPRGSNGAGQAILDARALTDALRAHEPVAALAAYEKQRLEATTRIVLTNRSNPPDAILREVFLRSQDKPFRAIEDVISLDELRGAVGRLQADRRLFGGCAAQAGRKSRLAACQLRAGQLISRRRLML